MTIGMPLAMVCLVCLSVSVATIGALSTITVLTCVFKFKNTHLFVEGKILDPLSIIENYETACLST